MGYELAQLCMKKSCMLFHGDLGAGKTTLIKHILTALNCKDEVSSPTYAIVHEYNIKFAHLLSAYHIDLYRINELEELREIGFEDYLHDKQAVCLIEWPQIAEPLLPEDCIQVHLTINHDGSRQISVENAL